MLHNFGKIGENMICFKKCFILVTCSVVVVLIVLSRLHIDVPSSINWADEVSEYTVKDGWGTWQTHFSDYNPNITREDFMQAIKNGEYKTVSIDEFLALKIENHRLDKYLHAKSAQEAYPPEDRPRNENDIKSVDYLSQPQLSVSPILVARVHGADVVHYVKLDGAHRLMVAAIKKSPIKVLFIDLSRT